MLALTVPPNNTDALAYHMARAAAWAQHGGLYWIPNAPTDRMNEFQPFAEQQILFLLVAVRGGRLAALPQYLAELAMIVAVYGVGTTARLRRPPGRVRSVPARDVLAVRARGDDGTERPGRRVVPGSRGVPASSGQV